MFNAEKQGSSPAFLLLFDAPVITFIRILRNSLQLVVAKQESCSSRQQEESY